jgi:hypothetical protein
MSFILGNGGVLNSFVLAPGATIWHSYWWDNLPFGNVLGSQRCLGRNDAASLHRNCWRNRICGWKRNESDAARHILR